VIAVRRFRLDASLIGGIGLSLVVLTYGWLAFAVLSPDAVYAGDIGVKYVQARSLADSRFRSMDIPYRGVSVDPDRRFVPIRPPFVMPVGTELQAIFSPATAVLDGVFVALFDYRGMILAAFLSAVLILWLAWQLAGGPEAAAIPIVLGFGSPLWFYGMIGWEHAPAVAFGLLAFFVAARSTTVWDGVLAGVLLGCGAAIRDEVILLAPGLAFALWLKHRDLKAAAGAAAGVIAVVVAGGAVEVLWFHRPIAAHLLHAVHLLRGVFQAAGSPNPDVPALAPLAFHERYDAVIGHWLSGYGATAPITACSAIVIAGLASRWIWNVRVPMLLALLALIGLAVSDVWRLIAAPNWVAGMHRLSPYLVFAVLPAVPPDRKMGWMRATALFCLISYVFLALVGADTTGGKSLGPRLLLPLLPLLAVAAWQSILQHLRSPESGDRWAGRMGLLLVALAVAVHLGGTIPAYARRSAEDGAALKSVRASAPKIVIADDPFTAQLLLPLHYRKVILLADSQPLANELAATLLGQRFSHVLVVSRRPPDRRFGLPGYRRTASTDVGRMTVEEWHR
jgi:hypothetical protein